MSELLNPGKGYRFLEAGEILEGGDEFYSEALRDWTPIITLSVGFPSPPRASANYRRRILKEPPDVVSLQDLADAILRLSPVQRAQPVQCLPANFMDYDNVVPLDRCISIGTLEGFGIEKARSSHNNKYCPEDIVLLLDVNPYAEDGTIAWEFQDLFDPDPVPIYGKEGPTDPSDQMAAALQKPTDIGEYSA